MLDQLTPSRPASGRDLTRPKPASGVAHGAPANHDMPGTGTRADDGTREPAAAVNSAGRVHAAWPAVSAPIVARPTRLPYPFSASRAGALVAAALAAGGALFVWQSSYLDLGHVGLPGPGFFPLLLGTIVMATAASIAISTLRSTSAETTALGHRDVLITVVALLLASSLFEPLGAYLTLWLFGTTMLVLIARVAFPAAGAAAGAGIAACWYFFHVLLGVQLPTGPL